MTTNKLQILFGGEYSDKERKKALRAHMKKRRADNANRDVKESLLVENLFGLFSQIFGETQGAGMQRNVFVYMSFSSEAPTDTLIETFKERGYFVLCPKVEEQEMLPVAHEEDFTLSRLGIREPVGQAWQGNIDVIIAPLLAVDAQGYRLGYGGGYYDRFFQKYPNAIKIGYAFDFQVLDSVPSEAHDIPLDYTVTDRRILCHHLENKGKDK